MIQKSPWVEQGLVGITLRECATLPNLQECMQWLAFKERASSEGGVSMDTVTEKRKLLTKKGEDCIYSWCAYEE